MMAVECLCRKLGRMFEPYIIAILPVLLAAFGDPKAEVRRPLRRCVCVCWSSNSPLPWIGTSGRPHIATRTPRVLWCFT